MNRFWCKLAQLVHGEGGEMIYIRGQEVKGQGHKTPNFDLEASFSTPSVD